MSFFKANRFRWNSLWVLFWNIQFLFTCRNILPLPHRKILLFVTYLLSLSWTGAGIAILKFSKHVVIPKPSPIVGAHKSNFECLIQPKLDSDIPIRRSWTWRSLSCSFTSTIAIGFCGFILPFIGPYDGSRGYAKPANKWLVIMITSRSGWQVHNALWSSIFNSLKIDSKIW